VRSEDVTGLAAKQQVEGAPEDFAQASAERFVKLGRSPAA
jgi:hypothetical protein